jgi:hypothetical protein
MSQAQLRRLARLENLASAYIQRHHLQQDDGHGADRELDFIKVANIAILVRYGDPHIGEPLRSAWQRCLQSPAWRALRAERPDALVIRDYNQEATPFSEAGARVLAEYFRRWILPDLSGAYATEKLNRLLSKTPPWLLWFTHGDTAGIVLGLKVPDPFDRRRYARPSGGKPYLPEESFAWRLLPDGRDDEFLGGFDEFSRQRRASLEALTPRQRLREERTQRCANVPAAPLDEILRKKLNSLVSSPLAPQFNVLNRHYPCPPDRR